MITAETLRGNGIGGHQSGRSGTYEWLTPPGIIRALGKFDLDPCSPVDRPWPTATHHFTQFDDGLSKVWKGRVWLNPPYGLMTRDWLRRLADHGDGIALVFARTETAMFHEFVWPVADAVFFLKGRLNFHHLDGRRSDKNSGGPSVLIAYGGQNVLAIERAGFAGHLVKLKSIGGGVTITPAAMPDCQRLAEKGGAASHSVTTVAPNLTNPTR